MKATTHLLMPMLVFLIGLVSANAAHAHKPSDAYLQWRVQGNTVTQQFDIALRDLDRDLLLDADDNGQLTWGEVRTRWSDIEQLALQGATLRADGMACTPGLTRPAQLNEHSDGRYAVVMRDWACPSAGRLSLAYSLFAGSDPTHRGIVRWLQGERSDTAVFTAGVAGQPFAVDGNGAGPVTGFGVLVKEGVHHILIGTDHVLFLLALLLPTVLVRRDSTTSTGHLQGRWEAAPALQPVLGDVFRVVTAFTVAHSITLALAAFEVLDPPSRWVESIIAASVVFAALNNLVPWVRGGRWKLTFAFGLVHGFGFAGALKDIGLRHTELASSLFAFNLGVELGQLAIVALFLAVVWRLRNTRLYRRVIFRVGSVAIALLATVWLVERAFDLQWSWPL
jgi:hypothetical protein